MKRGRTPAGDARGHDIAAPGRRAALATGSLVLLLALGHIVALWFVCDDAFISFRYAANLVRGHGLVYNPGERVEGYSNFLWTIVSALVIRGGGKPEFWAPILSAGCALATLGLVMAVLHRRRGNLALVGILLAGNIAFAAWATSGLETALYTLLVTAGVLATIEAMGAARQPTTARGPEPNVRLLLAGSLFFALASLTRPDGMLVSGLAGVFLLAMVMRGRVPVALGLAWVGIWLVCVAPHVAWRLSYYGRWLPNSSAVKTPGPGLIAHGAEYLGLAAMDLHLYLLAALVLVARWAGRAGALERRDLALVATIAIPYLAYLCTTGGDFMPLYRFVVPMLPLMALVTASALAGAAVPARAPIARALTAVLVIAYLGLHLYGTWRHQGLWAKGELTSIGWARADADHWRRVGTMLRTMAGPTDTLATTAAGAIPYYSELVTIDLLGIVAPDLSRYRRRQTDRPGHRLLLAEEWIDRARPQILLGHPLVLPTQKGIGLSLDLDGAWRQRILAHYQVVGIALPGQPVRYLACALRNDVVPRMIEARRRAGR